MIVRGVSNGPFLWLAILLCPAAAGLTGWLGGMIGTLYQMVWGTSAERMQSRGLLLGLLCGLAGAAAWCGLMIPLAVRGLARTRRASPRIVAWGALAGHAAGLLALGTLIGGMMACDGRWNATLVLGGLAVSAVGGLALGALGGLLTWGASALALTSPRGKTGDRPR